MFAGLIPKLVTLSAFVDIATKCLATWAGYMISSECNKIEMMRETFKVKTNIFSTYILSGFQEPLLGRCCISNCFLGSESFARDNKKGSLGLHKLQCFGQMRSINI